MNEVVVLGAKGRFGRAAVAAFSQAGWTVRAFGRNWSGTAQAGVTRITGDVLDRDALGKACAGCDVIVNAINPPYEQWVKELPGITSAVIAAAKAAGATVLIPGNVYNYGADAPAVLSENTPWQPTTRKGQLRVDMEESFRASGVRTIVLRGGDFIEAEKSGNWFDGQIAAKAQKGRTAYPGPLHTSHAWAYLPDMAKAAVLLAEARNDFAPFEEFGFPGFGITGQELVDAIAKGTGQAQKVGGVPWPIIRLIGFFNAGMRELVEMRYLWNVPHVVDGSKLMQVLPGFKPTTIDDAMRAVLK